MPEKLQVAFREEHFIIGYVDEPPLYNSDPDNQFEQVNASICHNIDYILANYGPEEPAGRGNFAQWYYNNVNNIKELYESFQIQPSRKKPSSNEAEGFPAPW